MKCEFTFIDLFAGIGGFHLAMHELGGRCVFASEIDTYARKTYESNFKKISPKVFMNFNKDIKKIMPQEIPDFDLLCAGFPCQPFSQAGKRLGFNDNLKSERGGLFFNIAEIIREKQPKAYLLENVQGLIKHDGGNTFQVIKEVLTKELGYSFYFQKIRACDYGLPQLRPRVYIVGFREGQEGGFNFPEKQPLDFTMSDVLEGRCTRDIGFTLRVGGGGSGINDRRNWDHYEVDGLVKRITYRDALKMQGFPSDFKFPVSPTQAMKQLGNSVAVNAAREIGRQIVSIMNHDTQPPQLHEEEITKKQSKKNKGEWTELFAFLRILLEQRLHLSDSKLNKKNACFKIHRIALQGLEFECVILDEYMVEVIYKKNEKRKKIPLNELVSKNILRDILLEIKTSSSTFLVHGIELVNKKLGYLLKKRGGLQKSDIVLGVEHETFRSNNEMFSIKSFLGSAPTLLNASGNTNFTFSVYMNNGGVDDINLINTKNKVKERVKTIQSSGGRLVFKETEKETMDSNLKMIDAFMPELIGNMLILYYSGKASKISDIVDLVAVDRELMHRTMIDNKVMLEHKVKQLLLGVLLGMFYGSKWNGAYESNGAIIVKSDGDILAFHVVELNELRDYLYNNIKFDTPSSTRHGFGVIIQDKTNVTFKLNLQLRFTKPACVKPCPLVSNLPSFL